MSASQQNRAPRGVTAFVFALIFLFVVIALWAGVIYWVVLDNAFPRAVEHDPQTPLVLRFPRPNKQDLKSCLDVDCNVVECEMAEKAMVIFSEGRVKPLTQFDDAARYFRIPYSNKTPRYSSKLQPYGQVRYARGERLFR